MKTNCEMRDEKMREMYPAKHYELFGELIHAILEMEDAVEEREFVRWKIDELHNLGGSNHPTYEQRNAEVTAAINKIISEAIGIAVRGDIGIAIARQHKRTGPRLVVAAS